MAIYAKKDSVNTRIYEYALVNTGKMKKWRWLHLIYGIHMSYFWSGPQTEIDQV